MRKLLVTLIAMALTLFCTCRPAIAANELIGFDANSAAVLKVMVVNAADGTSLNIHTLVFEDYNGTAANYYITPTTLTNDANVGIWKADMPASTPACSYFTIWIDSVLVNHLVYQSPRERWTGTAKIFDNESIPTILTQANKIPASPAAVGSAMTLDTTTHTAIQTDVNVAFNTSANAAIRQADFNTAFGTTANATIRQADTNTALGTTANKTLRQVDVNTALATSANKTLRQADVNTALIAQHVTTSGDSNGVNVSKIYDVNAMDQIQRAAHKGSVDSGNPTGGAYRTSVTGATTNP